MDEAIRADGSGVAILLEVVPGARATQVPAGWNPWRKRVQARVRAPPEDGRANRELEAALAVLLGVPGTAVRVTTGHTSRQKTVHVDGLDAAEARRRLAEALP